MLVGCEAADCLLWTFVDPARAAQADMWGSVSGGGAGGAEEGLMGSSPPLGTRGRGEARRAGRAGHYSLVGRALLISRQAITQ